MKGAAEEKSPGISIVSGWSRSAGQTLFAGPPRIAGPCGLEETLGVVSRRHGLDDHGRPAGRVEPSEQDARLDLRARHGQLVADRIEPAARDREGCVTVRRLDPRSHLAKRLGDPLERPAREGLVSRQDEMPLLAGQDPCQEPHERARIGAVDRLVRLHEASQPDAVDVDAVTVDLDSDSEVSERLGGRQRVRGAAEARGRSLAVRDGAEQKSPV